jgi:hypothetical protein
MLQSTDESVRSSAPRVSLATLKAQERRRKAQYPYKIFYNCFTHHVFVMYLNEQP